MPKKRLLRGKKEQKNSTYPQLEKQQIGLFNWKGEKKAKTKKGGEPATINLVELRFLLHFSGVLHSQAILQMVY